MQRVLGLFAIYCVVRYGDSVQAKEIESGQVDTLQSLGAVVEHKGKIVFSR